MRLLSRITSPYLTLLVRGANARVVALAVGLAAPGCMQATQVYPLVPRKDAVAGSVSVERIEGGQKLVVLQFAQLPPPERLGPGLHEYVVWLGDTRGTEHKVGTLDYDRDHQSGNLLATTHLPEFTVRVTGERDSNGSQPNGIVLAERAVLTN